LAAPLALTLPLRLPLTRRQLLLTAAGMPLAAIGTTGLVRRLASPYGTLPGPSATLSGPIPLQVSHGSLERRNGGWQVRRRLIQLQTYGETLADGVILRLLPIPAGRFLMGSPPEEPERSSDEGPQREVRLQSFLMGQGPITQAQWRVVALWKPPAGQRWQRELKPEPSRFKGQPDRGQRPVENVSWEEAREFCRRLSQRTGRTYTLPSEAQWEYACRAGTKTPFAFGETISPELANYDGNYSFGDGPTGVSRGQTTPVGKFPGNAWGLQDMHGNVWEWCLDHWHENYEGAPIDGSAWLNKDLQQTEAGRLLRGGAWFNSPQLCRSAFRIGERPAISLNFVGFRVCCLPPGSLLGS
jgi:formylglycine-generating enzyme required for sulfatase activity